MTKYAELARAVDDAMAAVAINAHATLHGVDRSNRRHVRVGDLRLPARDVAAMTLEELESAMASFDTSWEHLPDAPDGTPEAREPKHIVGLAGWLPETKRRRKAA